jgi:hypothetical protein
MVFPAASPDDLNQCSKTALKKGFFSDQILVDASGRTFGVQSAKKVHGVGPFWGYNLFLNQRIKVELTLRPLPSMSLEEVRARVREAFTGNQRWDASADMEGLQRSIASAPTIREMSEAILRSYFKGRRRN